MRIQIVVTGFNRSLSHTWNSIEANVIQRLKSQGHSVTTSLAISRTRSLIVSAWSGENDYPEYDLPAHLEADEILLFEQDDVDSSSESLRAFAEATLPRPEDPRHVDIVRNIVRNLEIQKRASALIDARADYVFYTRPDIRFLEPVSAQRWLSPLWSRFWPTGSDVLVPIYGGGKHPKDHFALMDGRVAKTYLGRISQFESYVRSSLPFSAEAFLGYSLRKLTVERALKTRVQRVRAGGKAKREKYKVAKPFVRFIDQSQYGAKGV